MSNVVHKQQTNRQTNQNYQKHNLLFGASLAECHHGWYGAKCDRRCPSECAGGISHKQNGTCVACPATLKCEFWQEALVADISGSLAGVSVALGILFLIVALIATAFMFMMISIRRRSSNKASEDTASNQHNPESSTVLGLIMQLCQKIHQIRSQCIPYLQGPMPQQNHMLMLQRRVPIFQSQHSSTLTSKPARSKPKPTHAPKPTRAPKPPNKTSSPAYQATGDEYELTELSMHAPSPASTAQAPRT